MRQQILDQRFLLDDMKLDIGSMTENIEDVQGRKIKLQDKVKALTSDFVGRVTELTTDLDHSKSEVTRWKTIRDQFKKLSEELETDRESGTYRY